MLQSYAKPVTTVVVSEVPYPKRHTTHDVQRYVPVRPRPKNMQEWARASSRARTAEMHMTTPTSLLLVQHGLEIRPLLLERVVIGLSLLLIVSTAINMIKADC